MDESETGAPAQQEVPEPREVPEGSPTLEGLFEAVLWHSRFLMVVPVIVGILMAAGTFYVACVDTVYLLGLASRIADITLTEEMRQGLRAEIMASVVKVPTISLIGAALLLFSTGIYQLFIKRLADVERAETAALLRIHTLDAFAGRLIKLVLLALAMELLHHALLQQYAGSLDLLFLSGAILLVGLAFLFTVRLRRN